MNQTNTPTSLVLRETNDGKVLEVELTGKLTADDYQLFVPAVERMVNAHGKISILVEMHDFHGWTAGAMWEDIKFDAKHFRDIERVAIVGETNWQHAMALFSKPFTAAKVRYFPRVRIDQARAWLVAA
jgi:SpoIIAA-like